MSSRSEDFFKYYRGELHAEDVPISEILKVTGTPAYIYSTAAFLAPLKKLQDGLKGFDPLVCFAVKANSNLSVLRLLGNHGAGTDLVSGGELARARRAGIPGSKIVFSGVGKTRVEIQEALAAGVYSFHVESLPELELIHAIARAQGQVAPFAFRYNPNVDAKTHPYISTGLKRNKFGLDRKEILEVLPKLKSMPALRLRGVSIHIGSQLQSLAPLKDAFTKVRDLAREIDRITGARLEFVDLGGGLGVQYKNEKIPSIERYTDLIRRLFAHEGRRLLLEPGRTIAGNAGILATEVLFRKSRGKKDFLIVDAAMNDLIRPALYSSFHGIVPLEQAKARGKPVRTDVVGPVCESSDCFAGERLLSGRIQTADHLALLSVGADGFTMSSNYNSRPRPPEILVDGENFRIIRRRESFNDLVEPELTPDSTS